MIEPDEAMDVIHARFGAHPRHRALHAKGSWLEGTWTAAPAAANLSRAAHLQGQEVPVLARFSNGGGNPNHPDYVPDVRGLAVSFTLPDGSRTDMVAQSVPKFFSPTSDNFLAFIKANTGRSAALKMPAFLAVNPHAIADLPANAAALKPLASYATSRYFGVHAFGWVDPMGTSRAVRWTWIPQAGDKRISGKAAKPLGRDYLQEEIAERAAEHGIRMDLEVTIAAPGDPTDDPSKHWPKGRDSIIAGTLELTGVIPDPETDGHIVVFDPTRMTDGIELSDDAMLAYRARAYSASAALRLKG